MQISDPLKSDTDAGTAEQTAALAQSAWRIFCFWRNHGP